MKKYLIRLAKQTPDEPDYPYERFDTEEEAQETALFRAANHKLPFEVLRVDERANTLTVINRFSPRARTRGGGEGR
jgi:hypothetical protein